MGGLSGLSGLSGNSGFFGGGFDPRALSVPLSLWLSTRYASSMFSDAGATQANANDAIQQWSDLSGNGYHATQTTVSKKPLLKTNQLNGLPVVRFDGTDDWLQFSGSALSVTNAVTALTIIVVGKHTSTGGAQSYINYGTVAFTNKAGLRPTAADGTEAPWRRTAGDIGDGVTSTHNVAGAFHVLTGIIDSTNNDGYIYVDGTNRATDTAVGTAGTAEAVDARTGAVGSRYDGAADFLNGDIAEMLLFRGKLTDIERLTVERWLGSLYGVTVA